MDLDKYLNNEFGFDANEIIESNRERDKFIRVTPSKIESVIDDYFENGKPKGIETGIEALNPIFRWRRKGGLYIITGNEQSGKSELIKYLATLRGKNEKIKTALFSPEEDAEDIIEDLAMKYLGKPVNDLMRNKCDRDDWERAKKFIESHILVLDFDGMVDFQSLLKEYEILQKLGYGMFVTDPWNYVAEGSMDASGTRYLRTALSHMYTFSKRHNIWNIIVEHQNNKTDKNGNQVKATKDNIQGGSMWKHKATGIIIVHNNDDGSVEIEIAKNKNQRYNGVKGSKTLYFDIATGRYLSESPNSINQQSIFKNSNNEQEDTPF